jgi:hypothetical protein
MDSVEIVLAISCAFVFPVDIVKTCRFSRQSPRFSRSRLPKPLAHRLRYALIVSRMLKKAVQQGRNKRRGEAYASVR